MKERLLTGRTDNIGIASLDPEVTDSVKNNFNTIDGQILIQTLYFMGDKNLL